MIGKKMQKALNTQLQAEAQSAYLYLSMSADFASKNLLGVANWMRVQYQEEMGHAMKFFDFIIERGGKVELQAITAPKPGWPSPLAAFEETYAHEQKVTGLINDLVNLAVAEKDHATANFLQWFVKEQVEEEASANSIVEKLKMVGDAKAGLYIIDRELAARK